MSEPQLGAEMEKRLKNCDGYQCDSCYGTGKDQKLAIDNGIDIDCQKCGGSGVTELAREVRNFLATVLEENSRNVWEEATSLILTTTKPFFDAGYEAGKKIERHKVSSEVTEIVERMMLNKQQLESHGCGIHNGRNECCRNETLELVRSKLNQMKGS